MMAAFVVWPRQWLILRNTAATAVSIKLRRSVSVDCRNNLVQVSKVLTAVWWLRRVTFFGDGLFNLSLVYSLATKHNAKKEILFSASLQLILLQHRLDSLHQTIQTLLQAPLAPIPRIGNMSIAMFVRLPGLLAAYLTTCFNSGSE